MESTLLRDVVFEVGFAWGSGQDVKTDTPHLLSSLGWKWGPFNFADDRTPATAWSNWVEKEDGRRRLNVACYFKNTVQKDEIEIAYVSVERLPEPSEQVKVHLRARVLSRLMLDSALVGPLTDAQSKEVVAGPPYTFPPGDYSFHARVRERVSASMPSSGQ